MKALLYIAAGVSVALLARKFFPGLVRELRQEFM